MLERIQEHAAFASFDEVLRQRCAEDPDSRAYQFLVDGQTEGPSLTHRQLDEGATRTAIELLNVLQPGERALLLFSPSLEFLIAFFGCLRAGVLAVPLPPPDTTRLKRSLPRLESVLRDASARLVLTTSDIMDSIQSQMCGVGNLHKLTWINTEVLGTQREHAQQKQQPTGWQPKSDSLAFLQYTSGSTSTPKGVMVSHGNLLHQCGSLRTAAGYDKTSVACTWMPYHHDYGLVEGLLLPLFVGIPCYVMSPLAFIRRPIRWLEAISKYRVTHSQAPNFAYDLCVRKITPEHQSGLDLSSWTTAANAAEPVRPQTLHAFFDKFKECGLQWESLAPAYGLAEATLIVSHTPPAAGPKLLNADLCSYEHGRLVPANGQPNWTVASSGKALDETKIEIVDLRTRLRCEAGKVGEIWVQSPSVAQGYWNRLDETRKTFQAHLDGTDEGPFLRTGDLGCLKDGELYVTGRAKDLIIIRGLNHYPQDIELTVEHSHPALRPACVAAFSVDVNGLEELVVVSDVQGRHRSGLDTNEVFAAIRSAIFEEHDLRIHAIALLNPGGVLKTTSGKIQRAAIKRALARGELECLAVWNEAETRSLAGDSSGKPDALSTRDWLVNWLADKAGVKPELIEPSSTFADCGLDSMRAAELADDLEAWLRRRVQPTVFWNYPTIDALAIHLDSSTRDSSDTPNLQEPESRQPLQHCITSWNSAEDVSQDDIAIIGMGCRFPGGVDSPDAYWKLLRDGIDAITEVPPERWTVDDYFAAEPGTPGKMYARHGGFVKNVDYFDAAFFGISPREAMQLDPQQRLLLEVAWESLEHAGIAPSTLCGSETGVFIGMSSDDFAMLSRDRDTTLEASAFAMLGSARSVAAGRIAYFLGLRGPAIQFDTACSSSLVAVQQACQSLQAGESSLAIAGGVNLMLSPETTVSLCKARALAADGRCKTFDAAADGYVRGEGCGLVILKLVQDAVRDGDVVLARIRAAVANHDGSSNGLAAPNGVAQEELHRKAIRKANLPTKSVAYIEAHGPGTSLGDPIELDAIQSVYGQGRPASEPLYVGSVKTNIGHLEAAAGIAGLQKVVLMLQHEEIVPHLHFNTPNPHVDWDSTALTVPIQPTPWPTGAKQKLAAISSFGMSGTNVHLILEAEDRLTLAAACNNPNTSTEFIEVDTFEAPPSELYLLPLSAESREALVGQAARYAGHIVAHPKDSLLDICFSAATNREHFKHRLAVVGTSREELIKQLQRYASGVKTSSNVGKSKIAFLFTGQGSQYPGMGRQLYDTQPVFRAVIDQCNDLLQHRLDYPLIDVLYSKSTQMKAMLDQTAYAQPAVFSLECALVELWKSWGIQPQAVLGHSLGEYAAAYTAGVFDLETGLTLTATRGRLGQDLKHEGVMVAAFAAESLVAKEIASLDVTVSIAAVNGPESTVISGERTAVHAVTTRLQSIGVDTEVLKTTSAGHSALLEPMMEPFRSIVDSLELSPPTTTLLSNLTGECAGDEVTESLYWVNHLRSPVRFYECMNTLLSNGHSIFVELGPNPNLLAMGMGCVTDRKDRKYWLPSLGEGRDDLETMYRGLAELYVQGASIDWTAFHKPFSRSRVALPTYAFQRQPFPISTERGSRPASVLSQQDTVGSPGTNTETSDATASSLPQLSAIAGELQHLRVGLEGQLRDLTPKLNEVAIIFVIRALEQLGIHWNPGNSFSLLDLARQVTDRHLPKTQRVLSRLIEAGYLSKQDKLYSVRTQVPNGDVTDLLDAVEQEHPGPECDFVRRAGPLLASIWRDEVEPLSILFPGGATKKAVSFYSESRLLVGYNELASNAVRACWRQLPDSKSLRILEVGAGTGGLTMHLLADCPANRCEYVFTDVSPFFLHAANEQFREFPFLNTSLLDISQNPTQQGFEPGSFDVVIAANVLHATPRLHNSLTNVRQLLKPGGWLILLEVASPPLWADAVFTLIDGWWSFEDTELRTDHPLMRPDRWRSVLHDTGFEQVECLNDDQSKDNSCCTLYLAKTSRGVDPQVPLPSTSSFCTVNESDQLQQQPSQFTNVVDVNEQTELTQLVLAHAAQVMRLAPEQIDMSQPLSELGLDSLMATELRAQLGRALCYDLTLNTLQMRRSVSEIAAYVQLDQTEDQATTGRLATAALDVNEPRAHLVPLQSKGDATPLFFVPAGYGDLFAFQDIAHAIGTNQPVYGLQPASAKKVKTIRQMSIYRIVSAYIDEIKKVQPEGPYLLSGYSAGGIIVVELARELLRQGNEVGLLVIFDPPSHIPFWLDWFYSVNYRISLATGLNRVVRGVRSRLVRRLFHTVLDEGLRTHTTVAREHRVAPYPGLITYFRATLSQGSLVSLKPIGRFWRRIAKLGTEVHWIPGTHYGMMRGRGASVVVDELRDCLARAKSQQLAQDHFESGEQP